MGTRHDQEFNKGSTMKVACTALTSLFLLLASCGGGTKANNVRSLSFNVERAGVNDGRTFYVLVKPSDEASFMSDSYEEISKLVQSKESDLLAMALIWPEWSKTIRIDVPEDQAVGVYCLFTEPTADWKLLLTPPLERSYSLNVGGNNVEIQLTKKSKSKSK